MNKETAGNNLRIARKNIPKTQREISNHLKVTVQTVSLWETGQLAPPDARLTAIAEAYRIDEHELRSWYQRDQSSNYAGVRPRPGFGIPYICDVVDTQTRLAIAHPDRHWLFHSVSSAGYFVSQQQLLAESVLKCAAAGVDIAFIILPGAPWRIPTRDTEMVRQELAHNLHNRLKSMPPNVGTQAPPHLWSVTPKTGADRDDDLNRIALALLGQFTRIVTLIETPANSMKPNTLHEPDEKLVRTIPEERYQLYVNGIWLDITTVDPATHHTSAMWVPLSGDRTEPTDDYLNALSLLRNHMEADYLLPQP